MCKKDSLTNEDTTLIGDLRDEAAKIVESNPSSGFQKRMKTLRSRLKRARQEAGQAPEKLESINAYLGTHTIPGTRGVKYLTVMA